eukprot:14314004-Heterocapsa_arctica.AAC.1
MCLPLVLGPQPSRTHDVRLTFAWGPLNVRWTSACSPLRVPLTGSLLFSGIFTDIPPYPVSYV